MSAEQNKQVVGRLFNEAMNQRRFELLNEIIAPEFVNHGMPGAQQGPEGMRQILQGFLDAFPDMKITVEHIVAEGDMVATRGHWVGTNKGSFMGGPASGNSVRSDYVDFWKMKDGKCIENWVQMDMIGIMMQTGAMAAPQKEMSIQA